MSLLNLAKKMGAKIAKSEEHRFNPGDLAYVNEKDALSSDFEKGEEVQVLYYFSALSYEVLSTRTGSKRVMMDAYLSATREEAMR